MSQNNMAIQLNKGVIYLKSITGINAPTYWLRAMSQRTHFSDNRQIITVRNSSCGKVMFSQVSVCPQGRGVQPLAGRQPLGRHPPARYPPGRHTSWADTPPGQTHPLGRHTTPGQTHLLRADTSPPPRWLLQRTVHILLECILVLKLRVFARGCNVKFCSGKCPVHNVLFTHYSLIFVRRVILPNCNLV